MAMARRFSLRMAPLAVLAAIVIAVAPPAMYGIVAWQKLGEQAATYAGHLGAGIREAIFEQPRLWQYNAAKIVQATTLHRDQADIAAVDVYDCHGEIVAASDTLGVGTGAPGGPTGSFGVDILGRRAAIVSVRMDTEGHWLTVLLIALISGPLGLAIGLLLYFFPTRVVRHLSMELSEANRGLAARVEAGVRRVRELSKRVVQTQEDERQRIARDLHDGLGQAITGLQLDLELAMERPDQTRELVTRSIAGCWRMLADLRFVVHELRPPELEADDLPAALRSYAELFEQRTGIPTYFHTQGTSSCSAGAASCVFRALQESLTNAGRHAQATEVSVRLRVSDGSVALEVTDDGVGFDVGSPTRWSGLRGLRERCELLGGSMEIGSAEGKGTTIWFLVPAGLEETP